MAVPELTLPMVVLLLFVSLALLTMIAVLRFKLKPVEPTPDPNRDLLEGYVPPEPGPKNGDLRITIEYTTPTWIRATVEQWSRFCEEWEAMYPLDAAIANYYGIDSKPEFTGPLAKRDKLIEAATFWAKVYREQEALETKIEHIPLDISQPDQ